MTLHYSSPALEAELAYRREVLTSAGRGTRTRPQPLVPRPPAPALSGPAG